MEQDYTLARNKMVEAQLKPRGIKSDSVLNAMSDIPRHLFVPKNLQDCAYDDTPLPIGLGQTISQPYIVAYMTEKLDPTPGMKILEIGTGSGYQAAILAHIGCKVYSVELACELAVKAKNILADLGFENVKIKQGNGYSGWPEEAPYDAIIVTAAPVAIPKNLTYQLGSGAKMIVPVGEAYSVQSLQLIIKEAGGIIANELLPVRFVPMLDS